MKSMTCRDMGTEYCDFKASGRTAKEVKDKMFKHADKVHPELLKNATEKEKKDMEKKMDKLIK